MLLAIGPEGARSTTCELGQKPRRSNRWHPAGKLEKHSECERRWSKPACLSRVFPHVDRQCNLRSLHATGRRLNLTGAREWPPPRGRQVPFLLSDDLHQDPLPSAPVKFPVEDLFPRPEVQPTFRHGDHRFAPHDLALDVRVGIVFAGVVVATCIGFAMQS